jgi:hypothetical protein
MARHLCRLALTLILATAGPMPLVHALDAASAPGNGGGAALGPVFSGSGPDAADYGAAQGFHSAPKRRLPRSSTWWGPTAISVSCFRPAP